jgi:hypothetical protein
LREIGYIKLDLVPTLIKPHGHSLQLDISGVLAHKFYNWMKGEE